MTEKINTHGLSRELIIHPGETLLEFLEENNMTQKELAIRTGMSEKHISTIINGTKKISANFAHKLSYVFNVSAEFWMNLQNIYDHQLIEYEELNKISKEEKNVLTKLEDVIEKYISFNFLDEDTREDQIILKLRNLFGISNLKDIDKLSYSGAYRLQSNKVDKYILYAWKKMCELLTMNAEYSVGSINVDRLKEKIPEIKNVMFLEPNEIPEVLTKIFAECGILFKIVPYFTGAPVQGFITTLNNGTLVLCVTNRQKFRDIFWFTLFHEIAHILNGDVDTDFIDFESVSQDMESRADCLARDILIKPDEYKEFINSGSYTNNKNLKAFAKQQKIPEYIVQGRLMKDKLIEWKARPTFNWKV